MICKTCKRELHQDWVCCPWCSTKNKAEAGMDKTSVYRFYAEQLKQSWRELAPNTVRGYQSPFRRCVDHFGDLPVGGITPAMIKAFLDSLGKTFCKKTVIFVGLGSTCPVQRGGLCPDITQRGNRNGSPFTLPPPCGGDDCLYASGVFFVGVGNGINRSNPGGFSLAAHIFAH